MKWPTASNNPVLALPHCSILSFISSGFPWIDTKVGSTTGWNRLCSWCCCGLVQLHLEVLVDVEMYVLPAFVSVQISLHLSRSLFSVNRFRRVHLPAHRSAEPLKANVFYVTVTSLLHSRVHQQHWKQEHGIITEYYLLLQ